MNSLGHTGMSVRQPQLPADASRILFIKHLPFNYSGEDMYTLFGRFGIIRQIRMGNGPSSKGRAYVVYDNVHDARAAVDGLNGFNVDGRYLTVVYFKPSRNAAAAAAAAATAGASAAGKVEQGRAKVEAGLAELAALKAKFGVAGTDAPPQQST